MWGFFIDWQTTLECVLIALVFACLLCVVCFKPLGILQSFGYSNGKLLSWAGRKNNLAQSRLSILFISTALTSAAVSLCFSFTGRWSAVIGLSCYLIFFILYFVADASHPFRSDAKLTPRFKRLYITLFVVFAALTYLLAALMNFAESLIGDSLFTQFKYSVLSVLPLCALPIVCLANLIAGIWEKPVCASYVKQAKKSLAEYKPLVIGITGSYGKTSAKNILTAMLSRKFNVLATPLSYNTPQGIAKTVNDEGLKGCDIFIAEMGARRKGDIAELCSICPPDYSLITGICPQHLESFKTLGNVISAKGEIIAATARTCFIAADAYDYFADMEGTKQKCDCVTDIKADSSGVEFTLTLGGKAERVKTRLLGAHSAYNIGLCARLAYELGVDIADIAQTIGELPFVEHRLQLLQSNGVNIIDDGYNSNVVGARAAVDALKTFGGKKVVVTPGLVELGVLEEEENKSLGAYLVGLDHIILVGETLVRAVLEGYAQAGGDTDRVTVVPDLTQAQNKLKDIITKGDCVLFLNDLPQQYL